MAGAHPRIYKRKDTKFPFSKIPQPFPFCLELAEILSIVSKIVLYDSVHVIKSSDHRHKYSEYRRSGC